MTFLVARNPDPESRLPYLVRLPIEGGLILKVRDIWPRTSRIFCARVDDGWPPEAEIVDEVPVTLCRRRGVAIDLVLDRPRENRSQFVFTMSVDGYRAVGRAADGSPSPRGPRQRPIRVIPTMRW